MNQHIVTYRNTTIQVLTVAHRLHTIMDSSLVLVMGEGRYGMGD